jgi:hypothetical protein
VPDPVATTIVAAVVEVIDCETLEAPETPDTAKVVPLVHDVPVPVNVTVAPDVLPQAMVEGETVKNSVSGNVSLMAPFETVSVPGVKLVVKTIVADVVVATFCETFVTPATPESANVVPPPQYVPSPVNVSVMSPD